jgi:hypothetical protein
MPEYDLTETRSNAQTAIWIITLAVFAAVIGAAFYLLAL